VFAVYALSASLLYALVLVAWASPGATILSIFAFGAGVLAVPLGTGVYLASRLVRAGNARGGRSMVLALTPIILLPVGYVLSIFGFYAVFFLIVLLLPAAPQMILILERAPSDYQSESTGFVRLLLTTLSFLPSLLVWALLVTEASWSQYEALSFQIATILGGGQAGFTVFEIVAPVFLVYIGVAAVDGATFLSMRGRCSNQHPGPHTT